MKEGSKGERKEENERMNKEREKESDTRIKTSLCIYPRKTATDCQWRDIYFKRLTNTYLGYSLGFIYFRLS